MNERRSFAVLGGVTILVVAGVLLMRRGHGAAAAPPARAERPAAVEKAEVQSPEAGPKAAEARRARDAMRAEILAALRKREAAKPAPPPPAPQRAAKTPAPPPPAEEPEPPHGHYEASYIQQHFRAEMFPMMRQCYEGALARRPKLAGKLVLTFAIIGDPEVGGIVEDADFADDSDLKDEEMETCIRESLMTLTFDKPPTGGGKVTVRYPVAFAPGDDEDEKHPQETERRPAPQNGATHAP